MSTQRENVIPFIVGTKEIFPLEAELAYIVGIVGDKIKKGGLFKKSKEKLTQVSKFYWRIICESINQRIILVDSLGLYGGGTNTQDLSLTNVIAQLKAIEKATTLKAYTENLQAADQLLILESINNPIFDQDFTRSTIDLVKKNTSQAVIDVPLILPTFESTINKTLIDRLKEITQFSEIQAQLQEIAHQWLGEVNSQINETEKTFSEKINKLQQEVNERIEKYKEKMDQTIDTSLQKANQEIFNALSAFESTTLSLTGLINPIQEEAKLILNDIPSLETPKFHNTMQNFLSKSKDHIDKISGKSKELENDRKNLAKELGDITQNFMNQKQRAVNEYNQSKAKALSEVDELRMNRDKTISDLTNMQDIIKRTTDSLYEKTQAVIENRTELINKSTLSQQSNVPVEILVSLFLIRFQEKNDIRYFVIPPLIKTYSKKSPDYPNAEMDSAIVGGMRVADKLAEELVFNRRLKASFDALRATNYLSSVNEFSSAVRQGLDYLIQHSMISSKGYKKISELLLNIEV